MIKSQKLIFFLLFVSYFLSQNAGFSKTSSQIVLFEKDSTYPGLMPRDIYIYLPPNYSQKNKYPVLYMQDGQNLFDPKRAFLGQTWQAKKSLDYLIEGQYIKPIILVAIDNTKRRLEEYTYNNEANLYLDFIIYRLIPKINQNFSTLTEAKNQGIAGSSLGGLLSLYAGLKYPKYFGLVAALSPSLWWDNLSLLDMVNNSPEMALRNLYIDSGTNGGEEPNVLLDFREILLKKGFREGESLKTLIQEGADHSEKFWAQRFPYALIHLFGKEK